MWRMQKTQQQLNNQAKTHMDDIEDTVIVLKHQMNDIKEELERQFLLNPDDEQLLKVIGMFNETFKETVKMEKVKQNVDEIVDGVISMLQKNVRTDDTKEGDECGKTDVKKGGKLGIDESKGTDDVETGDKSVAQKKVAYKYRKKERM
ncbi:hypothetical protein HanHA300_Chr04g0151991 [Helianthus annuus]|nr:hypothetical protein HanHA300_Chr04g0151991 [Helianthus annuus]KAJ0598396.1 hypothetical protein HanHA89_Chr04g0165351 [Helianthus annuus]KAJ0759005.1 hypothetical protein HanLR1_Chr04g0156701 [Helianthus annuus]KAJ0762654.1 hypothetical protein HanOQP8_Chr04g0163741 [Helianthus annuus]